MKIEYENSSTLSPTTLYTEVHLDYYNTKTRGNFPSILSEKEDFQVIIRVMAYALAKSYQQPRILKYLYDPELALEELLPRLADTLGFTYPLGYDLGKLRSILKYLQKIRRNRGTFNAIKQLVRLLSASEEEILSMDLDIYSNVEVIEPEEGFLFIRYDNIIDFEFTLKMLELVVPAGYDFRLENTLEPSLSYTGTVKRNRLDTIKSKELLIAQVEHRTFETHITNEKVSVVRRNQ